MPQIKPFDWQRIWWGEEFPVTFLLEIAFRSVFMYLLILAALRLTGKRGVKQLSLFELTIILGLGSAAGDAMFYHDVPILHAAVVFAVVAGLYLLFNNLTERSTRIEYWLEGKSVCIITDGIIDLKRLKTQNITYDELFGEMRQLQVEHLGQVRKVYLEATGEISIFFTEKQHLKPGMPIFPEIREKPLTKITSAGLFACFACGTVQELSPGKTASCACCHENKWLAACETERIT